MNYSRCWVITAILVGAATISTARESLRRSDHQSGLVGGVQGHCRIYLSQFGHREV